MSKSKATREVNLDRTFIHAGVFYGPGVVTVPEELGAHLEERMQELQEADAANARPNRADHSATGITDRRVQGTDPDTDRPMESESVDEPTFGSDDLPASQLAGKDDDELKALGLKKKDIRRLRQYEEEQAEEADEAETEAETEEVEE